MRRKKSVDDASVAAIDPVTGWVRLTGKAGTVTITAVYTEANGTEHTASYRAVVSE